MTKTLRTRAWFFAMALFCTLSLYAQNHCSHNGCGGVKCMGIIGLEEQRDSFLPPPAGFDPQGERDVVISVTYNGFTTDAQNAFQYAVDIWASLLTSDVPILIDANWEDIAGNTLGFAGPVTFFQNFNNAPQSNTYYPVALANKIAGFDLLNGQADVTATFDSGTNWYFGTDGEPGFGQYDFVSVVLHELGHGLGVTGSPTVDGGLGFYQLGNPIVYDTFVENGGGTSILAFNDGTSSLATQLTSGNLFFDGPDANTNNGGSAPEIYAPSTWQGGSSYSHLDEDSFDTGNVNSLMTPFIGQGEAIHTPGPVILGLMADIGWSVEETGGGDCVINNLAITQSPCLDTGDGLGPLPVITLEFDFLGNCNVEDFCYQENDGGFTCVDLPGIDIILESGDPLDFTNTNPGATYDFYYVLSDGTTSAEYSWVNGNCISEETICDCQGNEHTIGVLTWLGDGVLDDGTYEWNGLPVFFDCTTWGNDCGDGGVTGDPFGVCLGNLPPNNGCDEAAVGCTDPAATNYDPLATIDDGSCFYGDCAAGEMTLEQDCFYDEETDQILARILMNAETIGECFVQEVCVTPVGGTETCYFLPDFDIFIGNDENGVFLPVDGPGEYVVYYTTPDDISEPMTIFIDCSEAVQGCGNPFALNYSPLVEVNIEAECVYDVYICDCAGTQHSGGALVWLGDGFLDDGTFLWQDQPVDFNCATWGFDCADGGVEDDPFGVCEGNLPPNNGCDEATCGPLGMVVYQEDCADVGDGLLPLIGFEVAINGDCIVEDFCFSEDGGEFTCFNLPTLADPIILEDGDGLFLNNTVPGATYEFYFTTSDGSQSGIFTWVNGNCDNEETICDCDGNQHSIGVLNWLGDGSLDDGSFLWDGVSVNFNCVTWGFDCADGGVVNDPNGVCEGNLPPNNGCVDEVLGCTEPAALNYNAAATVNDGSCIYENPGCTDELACNFDPEATENDGSCDYSCYGCTDETADNYDADATIDDGSCTYSETGCTDQLACNFDPDAIINDGSCNYDCYGCTDPEAVNYDADATIDNGSCIYEEIGGCIYIAACNYDPLATVDDGSCNFDCYGCTDPEATNYDPEATIENGSCIYGDIEGCTDVEACNYDEFATVDDGSCDYSCYGCTDPEATNYDADATIDDGSCIYDIEGCTDPDATNYNPEATLDDGSCIYDCEYPVLEYLVVECSDDADDLYFVEIIIADLGNGAPYTISNDQNGDEVSLNFTGTIQVGPFTEGENVLLTVSSDQMTNCIITSPLLSCEVGVGELNATDAWQIFPNPANEWMTIQGSPTGEVTVDLVDVTGQLVKQDILKKGNESLKMNVAEVASGVYFVRLTYGDKVVTQKVTVRH